MRENDDALLAIRDVLVRALGQVEGVELLNGGVTFARNDLPTMVDLVFQQGGRVFQLVMRETEVYDLAIEGYAVEVDDEEDETEGEGYVSDEP